MDSWIRLPGGVFVQPVYEGYARIILPTDDGATYSLYDASSGDELLLIGTAATPTAAARLS